MRCLQFSLILFIVSTSNAQLVLKPGCDTQTAFGDITICLPNIEGLTECYTDERVRAHVDNFKYESNEIIGMYFTDSTYLRVDELGDFSYDDYFKVYAPSELKGMPVTVNEVDQMSEIIEGMYKSGQWAEMKKEIESEHESFSLEQPVLINKKNPSDNLRNLVFLMQINSDYESVLLVMTINIVRIQERLIFYAYYYRYAGDESLEYAEHRSRMFGEALISRN